MIWYLLVEFKKEEKEKSIVLNRFKLAFWIKYIVILIPISLFDLYAIYINNAMLTFVGLVIFGITTYAIISNDNKSLEKKFGSGFERYKKRIEVIRAVLIKMDLYSEAKVKYLIDLNNERKKGWKFSTNIFRPFATISTALLIPTITLLLKWIFDHTNITNDAIKYVGAVVTIILLLLSLVYAFKPILEGFLDKEYLEFESLQNMLQDIYLIDFVDKK